MVEAERWQEMFSLVGFDQKCQPTSDEQSVHSLNRLSTVQIYLDMNKSRYGCLSRSVIMHSQTCGEQVAFLTCPTPSQGFPASNLCPEDFLVCILMQQVIGLRKRECRLFSPRSDV
jgi:hypothetical protein